MDANTQANAVDSAKTPSHDSRVAALQERIEKEDAASSESADDDAARATLSASAPSSAVDSEAVAAKPTLDKRLAKLVEEHNRRREERRTRKVAERKDVARARELESENVKLRAQAAKAARWERASLAERLEMASEGYQPDQLPEAWRQIGSSEWKAIQKIRADGTDREKVLLDRLMHLESQVTEGHVMQARASAEREFSAFADTAKEKYPFALKFPRPQLLALAHKEADKLAAKGKSVTADAILASINTQAKQYVDMLSATEQQAAPSDQERKTLAKARPKTMTNAAAQERSSLGQKLSHDQRLKRLIARENART